LARKFSGILLSIPTRGYIWKIILVFHLNHPPMRPLLSAFFLSIPFFLFSQTCDCPAQLNWLESHLKTNYPGYPDKVTEETRERYQTHFDEALALAENTPADTACWRVLRDWTRWFADGHIQLRYEREEEAPAEIRARYAHWETIPMSEAQAMAYLDSTGREPIEGIYQADAGNYRIALIRNEGPSREYAAVLLQADSIWWMPGQVKFDLRKSSENRYAVRYYMRDHSERHTTLTTTDSSLEVKDLGNWYKIYPGAYQKPKASSPFAFTQLDEKTLLIRMGTMNEAYRKEFKELAAENKQKMETSPNWIIDVRGNGGGSDVTFSPILPYIYSKPVSLHATQLFATATNREKYAALKSNKNYPWIHRMYYGHLARKMKKKEGEFIFSCKPAKYKERRVRELPSRVVILVDGGCASSCEQLLLYARGSDKVRLLGEHSAGINDYGNLHRAVLPHPNFVLMYPTSRSCRCAEGKGLDNTGIPPNKVLTEQSGDWVQYAQQYLSLEKW
jgi:hypothetical protein